MKLIHIYVPEELQNNLLERQKETGASIGEIVRRALSAYFDRLKATDIHATKDLKTVQNQKEHGTKRNLKSTVKVKNT